jgi:hypothetical protein
MQSGSEADSLRFLEELYGPDPPGRILISTPHGKRWPTHACVQPRDALHYVLGVVDVFHRVTLVARKPKTGRGTAKDTSALTALWLDVDVNGSPDGRGGVVADAAADQKIAVDFLQSVLIPTMLVASGFGVHAYWLLAEPLLLHDADELRDAQQLMRSWHTRFKREARRFEMPKFDSVFDLARVLRPPGSMNGKGEQPMPVQLLDDGGPRYTLEQIRAEIVEDPVSPLDVELERSVEALLAEHPRLEKPVMREGDAPGKGSDSEWDYWLACESVRSDLIRDEFAALLRHAREDDAKSQRLDYVETTWEKARGAVTADERDPARRLNLRYNLRGDDAIVRGDPISDIASGAGKVYLYARGGRRYRFPYLDDLFDGPKHTKIVSQVTRSRFGALGLKEAVDMAQTIIALCGGDDADPLEEAEIGVVEFIAHAGATVEAIGPDGTRKSKWLVLDEAVQIEMTLESKRDLARRSVVIYDREKDELWLPAGALKEYSGSRKSWPDFTSDLREIGWRHETLDAWEPGGRAKRASGEVRHLTRNFYVGKG